MKRFIKLVGTAIFGIWLLNMITGYILQSRYRDWREKKIYFEPLRWDEFYRLPENSLDVVFLGSSHAYRSINPYMVDSVLNINTFNFGTSGQSMRTSYHVIQNVLEKQRPSVIILEVYFHALNQQDQLVNAGFNFPYTQWSRAKLNFWIDGFTFKDKCIMLFVPTFRYRKEWKYVVRKVLNKVTTLPRGEYIGKGFVSNTNNVPLDDLVRENHFDDYHFSTSKIVKSNIDYMKKIVNLCRNEQIKLIWVTAPIPSATYKKLMNPQEIHHTISELASENNIQYYNFLDARTLSLNDTLHFFDNNHLNLYGANKFTQDVIIPGLKAN